MSVVSKKVASAIAFLRENWWNDGAEGESVHLLCREFEHLAQEVKELRSRPKDDPESDATDGAHPAWWRGHDNGARGVALALIKLAELGNRGGVFSSPEVALAAGAIQDLRERLKLAETARDELSDALDRERLQHDETRGYRHQAEFDRDECLQGYNLLEACLVPLRAALDLPTATIPELVTRVQQLRQAAGE